MKKGNITILPGTLKSLRDSRGLTQAELADATSGRNKVGVATIKRIETASGPYLAMARVAKGLAEALRVTPEELGRLPDSQRLGVTIKATIQGDILAEFGAIEFLYGVDRTSLIEMTPLFFTMLAEASLAWRKTRVDLIAAKAKELIDIGRDGGHLAFVNSARAIEDAARSERESIQKRDLFGKYVSDQAHALGFNPDDCNPFSDYLAHLVKESGIHDGIVDLMPGGGWLDDQGLPESLVHQDFICIITDGDEVAEQALQGGHVRFQDIPLELMSEAQKGARVAWLRAKVPSAELKQFTNTDDMRGEVHDPRA